jgi:hypothetical protein
MNQNLSSTHVSLEAALNRAENGAVFSHDRRYRYLLWRRWSGSERLVLFIGLNPSTADETQDDPTIRRCRSFAESWSASGFMIANLFAYRATFPSDLRTEKSPVGNENDSWISAASGYAIRTIACWGNHGTHLGRAGEVLPLLVRPEYLRMTKTGQPSHPLYLPGILRPSRFTS